MLIDPAAATAAQHIEMTHKNAQQQQRCAQVATQQSLIALPRRTFFSAYLSDVNFRGSTQKLIENHSKI